MKSIFLSVVNSEYHKLRDLRKFGLERAGYKVVLQPTFPQTATDTISKLSGLIKATDCVVHIVGSQLGSVPNARCQEEFFQSFPDSVPFLGMESLLRQKMKDTSRVTYTQWEAYLAIHHRKPLLVYTSVDPEDPFHPQRNHLDLLQVVNRHAELFNEMDLGDRLLADIQYLFKDKLKLYLEIIHQEKSNSSGALTTDEWFK